MSEVTTNSRNPLCVAGIPFIHNGATGFALPERISPTWPGSRVTELPIRVHHAAGAAGSDGLRPLFEVPVPLGEYFLDGRENVAIRSRAMGVPGFHPQLMRTDRSGFEYAIQYADPSESLKFQWAWHRTIFMLALPLRSRGLTIHAAGFLLPDGGAIACPGISGAGKSTLARTLQQHAPEAVRILSDDRIAVTLESEGLHAWGTPWYSSAEAAAAEDGRLTALVFVAHGAGARLVPLAPGVAMRRLLRTVGFPFWDQASTAFALEFVSRLVADVPCFEFSYEPTPTAAVSLLDGIRLAFASGD